MIREKSLIRKQITEAIDREDFATAQHYMQSICKDEKQKSQRRWTKDEEEYLLLHVESVGLNEACRIVAKKLERSREAVRAKYYALKGVC